MDDETFRSTHPLGARPKPGTLNRLVARSLRPVLAHVPTEPELNSKPVMLSLQLPLPPRLRFYAFLATQHESERQADTYRIQLTSGDGVGGGRFRFSRAENVRPVLIGYSPGLDVFIIWDADVVDDGGGYTYSQGVQAPPDLVYHATATGITDGTRHVRRAGRRETIVAARRGLLTEALLRRIELSNQALTAAADAE